MFTKHDTCEFIFNAHFISSPVDTNAIASGMKICDKKKSAQSISKWDCDAGFVVKILFIA